MSYRVLSVENDVSWLFFMCGVCSGVFPVWFSIVFLCVSKVFQGGFKAGSRVFQGCFMGT